jgi:hypothetical protein
VSVGPTVIASWLAGATVTDALGLLVADHDRYTAVTV